MNKREAFRRQAAAAKRAIGASPRWLRAVPPRALERDRAHETITEVCDAYETKVSLALNQWLPDHAAGCDKSSTQGVCLRCDVFANVQVAFGFSRPLNVHLTNVNARETWDEVAEEALKRRGHRD